MAVAASASVAVVAVAAVAAVAAAQVSLMVGRRTTNLENERALMKIREVLAGGIGGIKVRIVATNKVS